MANTSSKNKEGRAGLTGQGLGVMAAWSLVQAEGRNLYRVEIKTPRGLRLFLLRIPCTVLDNGKVKLGPLDYTDQIGEALYLPLDLASSIVSLMTQKGVISGLHPSH